MSLNFAHAASLKDVKVLDVVPLYDGVELKLQAKKAPKDSYFFVKIDKSQEESFDKLLVVLLNQKDSTRFKINLEIPSFSPTPSGSYYPASGMQFELSHD